jgi:hypothetical protein
MEACGGFDAVKGGFKGGDGFEIEPRGYNESMCGALIMKGGGF